MLKTGWLLSRQRTTGLDTIGQTCEATAEREKRRAASLHRNLWEKVSKNIGEKILPQSYETWFQPLFIAEIGDTAIVFDAPDQLIADWLEENYIGLLTSELKAVGISDRSIAIEFLDSPFSHKKNLKGFEFNG